MFRSERPWPGNCLLKASVQSRHSSSRSTRWYQMKNISSSVYLGRGALRRSLIVVDEVLETESKRS